jgi:hypothetical protein
LKKNTAVLAWLGAAATVLLAGCAPQDMGPPITQQRGVDAFHSIDLRGAAELDVLVGTGQSLVVEGPSATLGQLATTVRNGMLVVELADGGLFRARPGKLKVRVTLPKLNSLALNGAGRISVSGLNGGATTMVLSGAGDLEASGTLDTLTARLNGAGNIDLSHLTATDASVAVNGAGNLVVHATGTLNAKINGVGAINYLGEPAQLSTEINGVGHIGRRDAGPP